MRWLDSVTDSMDMNLSKFQEERGAWCSSVHALQRVDSLEKTLMLEKIEGRKRRGQQGMRWLDGITDLMDMSLSTI